MWEHWSACHQSTYPLLLIEAQALLPQGDKGYEPVDRKVIHTIIWNVKKETSRWKAHNRCERTLFKVADGIKVSVPRAAFTSTQAAASLPLMSTSLSDASKLWYSICSTHRPEIRTTVKSIIIIGMCFEVSDWFYLNLCSGWYMTSIATGPELSNGELHGHSSYQRECESFRWRRLKIHKTRPYDRPLLGNKLHSIHVESPRSVKASHSQRCFRPRCALWNWYKSPLNPTCSKTSKQK